MKKPVAKLIGDDGNIFNLMAIASKALKDAGQKEQADEMLKRITKESKSYWEAIAIISDYVEVE